MAAAAAAAAARPAPLLLLLLLLSRHIEETGKNQQQQQHAKRQLLPPLLLWRFAHYSHITFPRSFVRSSYCPKTRNAMHNAINTATTIIEAQKTSTAGDSDKTK